MNLGRGTVFETVAYIGPSDLRYAVVFQAAVKCGYKVSEAICYYETLLNRVTPCSSFSHLWGTHPGWTNLYWNRLNAPSSCTLKRCHKRSKTCKGRRVISKSFWFSLWMRCFSDMPNTTHMNSNTRTCAGIQSLSIFLPELQVIDIQGRE